MAKPGPERPHHLIQSGGTLGRWTGALTWDLILSSGPITTGLKRTPVSPCHLLSLDSGVSVSHAVSYHIGSYFEAHHAE